MTYLSGSPLYNYTLAKELSKNHEVSVLSKWSDNKLKSDLIECGVKPITQPEGEYDLALVSQRDFRLPIAKKTINIVHSEYDCETPIMGLEHYVAIRPSIKEHLISQHGIPEEKITVIYNGVDLERFKPKKKEHRDFIKVVIPATIDPLRQKMFDYYVKHANDNFIVYVFGSYWGAKIPPNKNVIVSGETNNIEEHIADADIVAGILLGRVNLEARACDVVSYIHNPDNPEDYQVYYPHRWDFEEKHDIKKVAEQLLNI